MLQLAYLVGKGQSEKKRDFSEFGPFQSDFDKV
jgi:hypothetical protein